jgi:hypothetical protein
MFWLNDIAVLSIAFLVASCTNQQKEISVIDASLPIEISNDSLLTLVEHRSFLYFWEGADPISGMAQERIHIDGEYTPCVKSTIATAGSGFGIMALIVGIERGFITRDEGLNRIFKIVDFLQKADRYHGAWPHWINGISAETVPFSEFDDGADIVETAFLMQGLLTARQYFANGSEREKVLVNEIDKLWREVEWNWFTNGEDILYRNWSPKQGWNSNSKVRGWDSSLILYVLAASSPTFPINASVYHKGWASSGEITSQLMAYNIPLHLKHSHHEEFGGPLFWAQYSFLGLDPRTLKDKYANYWDVNVSHTLINRQWCIDNPNKFEGYGSNCWGLSASYSPSFFAAHAPGIKTDLGVISPSAALGSFAYTPEHSLEALTYFYYQLGNKIFGKYGFYDAFSIHEGWYPQRYLAISQGSTIVMIENYRTGLCWNLFMSAPEIKLGLKRLGFTM